MKTLEQSRSGGGHQRAKNPRRSSVPPLLIGLLLMGSAGIGYTADGLAASHIWAMLPGSGCNIKGNISHATGERIYHVPGQHYYSATRISLLRGERWFCSEEEALQAGWRRSRM
ncbi:sunset domain-containing protein [Chelativorans intermedius]|uniref:Succinoglycan biosynthesis protein n=1 Tax=Chelativorans intermedius TaxID=515947 RepID=A0ABV6D7K1_9HYPH|nr:hypothetical protein [Chelativorans intermedius]